MSNTIIISEPRLALRFSDTRGKYYRLETYLVPENEPQEAWFKVYRWRGKILLANISQRADKDLFANRLCQALPDLTWRLALRIFRETRRFTLKEKRNRKRK